MSEVKEPTFEEVKEKGIPMQDFCEFCNEFNHLYVYNDGNLVRWACDECEQVFQ